MFCCALSCGTCKNSSRDTVDKITDPVNEIVDSVADTVDPSPICGESVEYNSVAFDDFIDTKLTFVVSILRSDGGGGFGGFLYAICLADSMTYQVEQWAMNF